MLTLFTVLMLILSILLIAVVLLQPGKGDMISGMSGLGGQFSNMLGSRRATDVLSKITIGLATSILILSVVTNKFFVGGGQDGPRPVTEGVVMPKSVPTSSQQTQVPVPIPSTEKPADAPTQDKPATEQPEKK